MDTTIAGVERNMASARYSDRAFAAACALVFGASAALTIHLCVSMSATGMPMPGGWTMSTAWMRMPGQSWPDAAASFLGMWIVMMVAMMLPTLIPLLQRDRHSAATTDGARLNRLTWLVGLGYFSSWTAFGAGVFPLGVALATIEMQHPALSGAVPIATGVVVLIAGALQFTAWKARALASCRELPGHAGSLTAGALAAVRHGSRLGLQCARCCANLMAILLAIGVMDLRAMTVVASAIAIERMAPHDGRAARFAGAVAVAAGLLMVAQAAASG